MAVENETDLQNNVLVFLHQTKVSTQIIYSVTLLAVVMALSALPFIYTTVSVKGSGSLQSNIEKNELLAPVSGKITMINLTDNKKIKKGDLLLNIDPTLQEKQGMILSSRTNELSDLLNDATLLLKKVDLSGAGLPALHTGLYTASWQQFMEQTQNALNAKNQAYQIYARYEILFAKKVVTQAEYEQYKFNYDQALSDFNLVARKYKTQWQTEANQYRKELKDLDNQMVQLTEQEKLYQLTAHIDGTVQGLSGLQTGSFVSAGQKIGEISPDSALLAINYIKPSDIGLIKKGQEARFQIDAFNYNQWGLLKGVVTDISDDIVMINQNPYFKVKCKLNQDYLQLKNGYKGQVKKGMSFSARFTIAKRSLYQLLYDQVDDWLNPNGAKR
ncbi:HlyD family secretion protein [Pedobacter sp. GR22-10]|uniref:HlyD family secretion protein n=1 Tax=Pedobacter sp. GR22-10 TaxID=2994472 RepID=UPI0022453C38|nr:HlyD family efflux transporter periplasmic adaptor subunit [Pedobacter sp. GR22-10]MCX2432655.1 HlyD family efflux transporter periplasmic adaptor subunit [Pedobacter sp. GR22-10]